MCLCHKGRKHKSGISVRVLQIVLTQENNHRRLRLQTSQPNCICITLTIVKVYITCQKNDHPFLLLSIGFRSLSTLLVLTQPCQRQANEPRPTFKFMTCASCFVQHINIHVTETNMNNCSFFLVSTLMKNASTSHLRRIIHKNKSPLS